jgi:hypothetical protein
MQQTLQTKGVIRKSANNGEKITKDAKQKHKTSANKQVKKTKHKKC